MKLNKNNKSSANTVVMGEKPGSLPYIWRKLTHNPGAMIGMVFIVGLFILSFLAPYITPYKFDEIIMKDRFSLPSATHLLGCDEVGRDILSRILYRP